MSTRLSTGGSLLNRGKAIEFTFNGKRLKGFEGDTLASALLANDQMLVGRSFKYHRPRGIVASGAEEPNALVNLGESTSGCLAALQELLGPHALGARPESIVPGGSRWDRSSCVEILEACGVLAGSDACSLAGQTVSDLVILARDWQSKTPPFLYSQKTGHLRLGEVSAIESKALQAGVTLINSLGGRQR